MQADILDANNLLIVPYSTIILNVRNNISATQVFSRIITMIS